MTNLLDRLKRLDNKIKIGIVGIGSIGKGMVLQAKITPGIDCVAIADIALERAITWAEWLKLNYRVVRTVDEMHDVIKRGELAVCEDGDLITRCEMVDVFIEATNSIPAGGKHAISAIENDKHVVMMNYEADLIFGPYLLDLAQKKGRVYTVCDGDQPTAIKHIIDELVFMGFQLVMAGNIKGFLNRYADPTSIISEADKRNLDYRMCTSYTDGTKLCIEMAVLANGMGLRTTVPGMIGPRMGNIQEIFKYFDFERLWDGKKPIVDYVLGATPKGGVFAIGYTDHEYQRQTLDWFPPEMGPGPFYLFYRPYHLGHFESMRTVATAVLDGQAVLKPEYGFQTNVYAYAKRNLNKGETLDGIGGYTCYGIIENCSDNDTNPGLPICLADNVKINTDISKDEKIFLSQVDYDSRDYAFLLYQKAANLAKDKPRYGN